MPQQTLNFDPSSIPPSLWFMAIGDVEEWNYRTEAISAIAGEEDTLQDAYDTQLIYSRITEPT